MFHLTLETEEVPPCRVDCETSSPTWGTQHQLGQTPPSVTETATATAATTTAVPFTTGNPAVETIRGTVHLFKNSNTSRRSVPNSKLLAILAVPSYVNMGDLVRFVTGSPLSSSSSAIPTVTTANQATAATEMAPQQQQPAVSSSSPPSGTIDQPTAASSAAAAKMGLMYMKLLRNPDAPGRYMVVLQFADQGSADDFFISHHGRRFNSLETEECQVFYVSDVECVSASKTKRPLLPPADLTELPSCPVCLERMDSDSTGLLTILCNHTSHMECLAQWKDSGCPVCRFALQPLGADSTCSACECAVTSELWICLVCGHVGCGRQMKSHALDHWNATRHSYALNLETKRVWDYSGDNYVHRVVQSKTDGKLVEVDGSKDDKIVAVELEYSRLVQTHLAEFERQLGEVKRDHHKEAMKLDGQRIAALKQRDEIAAEAASLRKEKDRLQELLSASESERDRAETKAKVTAKKLAAEVAKTAELEELNKSLVEKQRGWGDHLRENERRHAEALAASERKVGELEGQLRDLMFHLDNMEKLAGNKEAATGAIITTNPTPGSSSSSSHSPTRRGHRTGKR